MSGAIREGILHDLGDGLVLRRAKEDDLEALSAFNAIIHSDKGSEKPDERVHAWTHDLIEKPHPTYSVDDFTIVEDTRTNQIVSSLNLISQNWSYSGIEFGVGRPELVGTHPDYRNRGLVRAQFDVVHQWSAERGELVQAITGIPYYYRQFGYEMAVNLEGCRAGYPIHVPSLKENEKERYAIRPARPSDIPFMMELYELGTKRSLLACIRDEAIWRYELEIKSTDNVSRFALFIVENMLGEAQAFFGTPPFTWGETQAVQVYEVKPGVSWSEITSPVIRYIKKLYDEYSAKEENAKAFGGFGFWLGENHPVYQVIPSKLPFKRNPYTWYLRVPDLITFMTRIAPVLEQRIEKSYIPGYSGEIKLSFYKGGLRLVFDQGKFRTAEKFQPTAVSDEGDAGFPGLTFLQLLFGYRSLDELRLTFPDCWAKMDEAYVLLNTLFPKQASDIWPVS